MKHASAFLISLLTVMHLSAQDFPGIRSGNYTGVNSALFNPANVADSRYKFVFNTFSINGYAGNNKVDFNVNTFSSPEKRDQLKDKLTFNNGIPVTGLVNTSLTGPSLMLSTGKKSGIAVTTRFRTILNLNDVDASLAATVADDLNDGLQYPYALSSDKNMQVALNAWGELGLSYARVISDKGAHFLKGGVTLKYLAGFANGYVNLNGIKGKIGKDAGEESYLYDASGQFNAGYAGIQFSDEETQGSINLSNSGMGADLGIVYEYRPEHEKYRVDESNWMRYRNKYKFKVSVALTDIGSYRFKEDTKEDINYDLNISGSERFYFNELSGLEPDEYNEYFRSKPEFFTPTKGPGHGTSVSLPTNLQIDLDYHLHRGFYASFAAQVPVSKTAHHNNRVYSSYTLTPRFESRAIGLYVPLNYNSLTEFNAGVALRLGPLSIGSGSLLTTAFSKSKQADFFASFQFAILQNN